MWVILGLGVVLVLMVCDVLVLDSGVGFDNGNFKFCILDEFLGVMVMSLLFVEFVSSEMFDVFVVIVFVLS